MQNFMGDGKSLSCVMRNTIFVVKKRVLKGHWRVLTKYRNSMP